MDIKEKMNKNKSYEEKNRGPTYMPRFVIVKSYCSFKGIIIITIKIKGFSNIDFKKSKYKSRSKNKN